MLTSDFDYHLPEELISQEPVEDRAASRLLVLNRHTGEIEHRMFRDLPAYVHAGDVLILNDTRVQAFRLRGRRPTGAAVEALFLERTKGNMFRALMKPGRRLHAGATIEFSPNLQGRVVQRLEDGSRMVELLAEDIDEAIWEIAETPLPPYIKKPLKSTQRYNTVYSDEAGSSAAPTAGLHFTQEILDRVCSRGASLAKVTLHVGASTFRPVRAKDLDDHILAAERIRITDAVADTINSAEGRLICVGTTSTRTVEAAAVCRGKVKPVDGQTDLFIKPGYEFLVSQAMLTNFHMPRSTLLVLVAAFAGREKLLAAYSEAVKKRYRFLSLGDAMLIL